MDPTRPETRRLDDLEEALGDCLLRDRHRLAKRLRGLRRAEASDRANEEAVAAVTAAIERSRQAVARRRASLPPIAYPPELPISAERDALMDAIRDHQVVIVCGETGSGKSTQLPKLCLDLGRGVTGMIGHTQPRRIAARSIARRIADELGEAHRGAVGWKVRFADETSRDTLVKLMTDGILLAETQGDRFLEAYDTVIIDEAHERSLNIDFLLGYIRQLLPKRPDLKVVITSATIDPERFSRHFEDAPVLEVSGRTYPVEIRYRPLGDDDDDGDERDLEAGLRDAVTELVAEGPGDILVFLPGERDIHDMAASLRDLGLPRTEVLPLFARLSASEQDRVFKPHGMRRVVLATNIAETSLTVPGIRYVIDVGTARISRYSERLKVQRLPIERVSQASAKQRAGRCGRVADGICIRLYAEEDHERRDRYTAPEILRTNLASVILRMKALGLGNVDEFPFIDPPRPGFVRDGYWTLYELGAVDDEGLLTDTGWTLARLPIDPRFGRMLVEAAKTGCLDAMSVVVSALSIQDPRERPADARADADQAHARFQNPASDFLGFLKLWTAYHEKAASGSRNQLKKWCRAHYLRPLRMREWLDIHAQLTGLTAEIPGERDQSATHADRIHRALLSGLLTNVAVKGKKHAYHGTHNATLHVFPGSVLFERKPKWMVSAERVETTRLYARTVAPIQRAWIEPFAGHLTKRSYSDAHWSEKSGFVHAYERVTLYGLVIEPRRRVHYGPIHPVRAREIFLWHALVHGRYRTRAPFHRHNREVLARARDAQARLRRRDLEVDTADLFAFFDERVPADVNCGRDFDHWRQRAEKERPRLLELRLDDLLPALDEETLRTRCPDAMVLEGTRFPLTYRFEPGEPDDGISMTVQVQSIGALRQERLDWLVPGRLEEKVTALLRTLPKSLRRQLIPLPQTVASCVARLRFGHGSLVHALAIELGDRTSPRIQPSDFRPRELEAHLFLHVRVVDASGSVLASGRDVAQLRRTIAELGLEVQAAAPGAAGEQKGLTDWTIPPLPEQVLVDHGGFTLPAYPSLVDEGPSVAVAPVDTEERARRVHRRGLRRLLALQVRKDLKQTIERAPAWQQMTLDFATLGPSTTLFRGVGDLLIDRAANLDAQVVRDGEAFRAAVRRCRRDLLRTADQVLPLVAEVLRSYHHVARKLMLDAPPGWDAPIRDLTQQIARLVEEGFLSETPFAQLVEYPRYLEAMDVRLQKLGYGELGRDQENQALVDRHWQRYLDLDARNHLENLVDEPLEQIRWMIEEYRVSLWAQELATKGAVSEKRLRDAWRHVRQ